MQHAVIHYYYSRIYKELHKQQVKDWVVVDLKEIVENFSINIYFIFQLFDLHMELILFSKKNQ